MRHLSVIFAATAGLSTGAIAQSPVSVIRIPISSTISMGLDDSGQIEAEGATSEPLSDQDLDMIRQLITEHPKAFGPNGVIVHSDVPGRSVETNHVRFTLVPLDDGKQSVLVIENGFPISFLYAARIGKGDRSTVTDVCQTIPGKKGYEHWPYSIDWIEISDIRMVEWNGHLRCE